MEQNHGQQATRADHADGHHGVVISGSMTGLLAARVLSDHFEQVTLVQRDRLTGDAEALL
jgi:stress-induced morphogen